MIIVAGGKVVTAPWTMTVKPYQFLLFELRDEGTGRIVRVIIEPERAKHLEGRISVGTEVAVGGSVIPGSPDNKLGVHASRVVLTDRVPPSAADLVGAIVMVRP